MQTRPIYQIAAEIKADWGATIDAAAEPYATAMESITEITDSCGRETAVEIVSRFLSLANNWRGPVARRIKAELSATLVLFQASSS